MLDDNVKRTIEEMKQNKEVYKNEEKKNKAIRRKKKKRQINKQKTNKCM